MGNACTSLESLKNKYNEYNISFNDRKTRIRNYYNDIQEKEASISDYRLIASQFNNDLSNVKDQSNITSSQGNDIQQTINEDEKVYALNDLEEITNKINEFQYLLENQKTFLKNLENNFKMIQDHFNDIHIKFQNKEKVNKELIDNKINTLNKYLEENQQLLFKLEDNKRLTEQKKVEIEHELKNLQDITNKKITEIKTKKSGTFQKLYLKKSNSSDLNKSTYLNGSMLLGIKNFTDVKKELNTLYLFKKNEVKENSYDFPVLLMKNWHETCIIYNDFDIHDITYELKAIELPKFMNFKSSRFFFEPDINVEMLLFEIDGNKAEYKFNKHLIEFEIYLENLQSNKIHIQYKESPKYEKMSEEQKAFRNIYRIKEYGLPERIAIQLVGQNAKYILKNESDLEIISFDNDVLLRIKDSEYQWGGEVEEGGKVTKVRMSKKEGIVRYHERVKIKTIDDSSIQNSNLKIPFGFVDGNNETIRNEYNCYPKGEINRSKNEQNEIFYDVCFKNINSNTAEFILEGELKNKCKTDWVINLTNEEIDSLVPPDFKTNKAMFKQKADEIIYQYDEEHKNDKIKINYLDFVKVGKWIKENIAYDYNCSGDDITATKTLEEKRGVCDHITKLFNAFAYSLGYQVIYANGFVLDKNTFGMEDNHAWSIININKKGTKWLPFDATNGIFSGKLPITHVYQKIGNTGVMLPKDDNAVFDKFCIEGSIR